MPKCPFITFHFPFVPQFDPQLGQSFPLFWKFRLPQCKCRNAGISQPIKSLVTNGYNNWGDKSMRDTQIHKAAAQSSPHLKPGIHTSVNTEIVLNDSF